MIYDSLRWDILLYSFYFLYYLRLDEHEATLYMACPHFLYNTFYNDVVVMTRSLISNEDCPN